MENKFNLFHGYNTFDQSLVFKSPEILFRSQKPAIIVILSEEYWTSPVRGAQFDHFLICLSECQLSVFIIFIGFPKTGYLDITGVCHDIQTLLTIQLLLQYIFSVKLGVDCT